MDHKHSASISLSLFIGFSQRARQISLILSFKYKGELNDMVLIHMQRYKVVYWFLEGIDQRKELFITQVAKRLRPRTKFSVKSLVGVVAVNQGEDSNNGGGIIMNVDPVEQGVITVVAKTCLFCAVTLLIMS